MYINDLGAQLLPYCIQQQDDGHYLILNRYYQPVGSPPETQEPRGNYAVALRITQKQRTKLSCKQEINPKQIYLYNDSCNPRTDKQHWEEYQQRLQLLCSLVPQPKQEIF